MITYVRTKVGVTGHQQLPTQVANFVREKLNLWIPEPAEVNLFSSLAVGADSIVADYLVERGAALSVVIPCQGYEATFQTRADRRDYDRLLQRADSVTTLVYESPSEEAFMAAGRYVAAATDWLFAVWDGQGARGHGGTGDVVKFAYELRKTVQIAWPEGVVR